jgi:uncharacterized protein YukE
MSQRVLSTEQARAAVVQMQSLLGELDQTINKLKQQGGILSDANNWDGQLANKFRNEVWPQCQSALTNTAKSLGVLQGDVRKINDDIMAAGGVR